MNIEVRGMDEINKKINEAKQKYPQQCKKGIELSCITVEKKAKQNCPVITGRLRSSITYSVGGDVKTIKFTNKISGTKETMPGITTGKIFEWYGIVGTNVEYAPKVELIPSERKGHPFLLPALYESKADIMKIFEDVLKSVEL
jgi:hypothetical protein